MQSVANVNGVITPLKEARISILDRGFLYGDSVYEVTRTYSGVPFYMEEHLARLENSAQLAHMRISQSRDFLRQEIKRTVAAALPRAGEDVFIRYSVTRGSGVLDLDPTAVSESSYIIMVKEIPAWKAEHYSTGMKLAVPSIRRNSPRSIDPNIKSGNYMNNILAMAEARKQGADDALLLSIEEKLTEASNSNVLFVREGGVVTPLHEPQGGTGNLRGLTKFALADICAKNGISYQEIPLHERDVTDATECFVSSATREIMPVKQILWENARVQEFAPGGGPVIKRLQTLYGEYVRDYISKNRQEALF